MASRRQRREEARGRVLDAATSCFLEKGFGGTSMRDVAERCGILSGSLYHHVSSKEELLDAVIEDVLLILQLNVTRVERYQAAGSGGIDLLRNLVYSNIAGCVTHTAKATIFFHELDGMITSGTPGVREWAGHHDAAVARCVEEGVERGEIRPEVVPSMACALIISMYGSLRRWEGRPEENRDLAEAYADLLVHAVAL